MMTFLLCTTLAIGQPGLPPGQLPVDDKESLGFGVIVTDSGQVFEGRIDRMGKIFRITSAGKSDLVRDVNVTFQGQTREEAYAHFRGKKKSDVAEDAAKLADWCRKNGLAKPALDEARVAVKLAPHDRALAKLLRDCEEDAKKAKPVIRLVGNGALNPTTTVTPFVAPPIVPTLVAVEPRVSPELETQFAKTVQPILMNLCANCHADVTRPVSFRLARVPDGITVSTRTAGNAAMAMAFVSKEKPQSSPLITKALSPHGGRATAPLAMTSTANKNLSAWVTAMAATMPATTPQSVPVSTPVVTPVPPAAVLPTPTAIPTPAPIAKLKADPFDPAEFNNAKPTGKTGKP